MWRERRANIVILKYFHCRWKGSEFGEVGKVGGWKGWEDGKYGKFMRLGIWERWESSEVGKLRKMGRWWGWEGGKKTKRQDGIAIGIACTYLEDCSSAVPLMGRRSKKKFFKNNSVKALIPFKRKHQDPYWNCMYLWGGLGGSSVVEKMGLFPKKEISLKQKNNLWGDILGSTADFDGSNKKWGGNQKKWNAEKCGMWDSEMQENDFCGGLVKILWDAPCATVLWKLLLSRSGSLLICKVGWLG